jgi:predicted CXXCH cytochrome family protein
MLSYKSLLVVCGVAGWLVLNIYGCQQTDKTNKSEPASTVESKYIGSTQCKSCHQSEFDEWQQSHHYIAMQPANDRTVLGDFNNTIFIADGVTSRFYKKEGSFYINTQGSDGKNNDYKVLYTFGFFPLQQYLISFPGGRMQTTRLSWDSREKKWFNQRAGEKIYHKDWLHWTGNAQNWNTMCASCHSTNLQKNYEFETDTYHTTWSEVNVACESCHGPGGKHADFVKTDAYIKGERLNNSGLQYAKSDNASSQLNTCAPCHARKSDIVQKVLNNGELMDNIIPQNISNEYYYADGQIRDENYEFGSFSQSKMFHNNVRCSNCHNPHSGKLISQGNALCLNCHEPKYNSEAHHFHTLNTQSAECINCHMPQKTYMGNDHRRDHSFRIPRPDQSVLYGTPNTCTSCHSNKTNKWAADAVIKWYGPKRAYHFSDDLLPGSKLNATSEKHLSKLIRDTSQPEIARATAIYYLGNIHTEQSIKSLLYAFSDAKPMVRYQAIRSAQNFPYNLWIQEVMPLLQDKVRANRIAAADLFQRIPTNEIPTQTMPIFQSAKNELEAYVLYQRDFALGNVIAGDYFMKNTEYTKAITHYQRSLQKDSLLNYSRLNLSSALSATGRNDEALKVLKMAATIDNKNSRVYYNLALLNNEMGQQKDALHSFEMALKTGGNDPNLYYNYGLLLWQIGDVKKAEQELLKGWKQWPLVENLNYALATFYIQQNKTNKALFHAKTLWKIAPTNPNYSQIFSKVGIY